jgi:hypothetical protein
MVGPAKILRRSFLAAFLAVLFVRPAKRPYHMPSVAVFNALPTAKYIRGPRYRVQLGRIVGSKSTNMRWVPIPGKFLEKD